MRNVIREKRKIRAIDFWHSPTAFKYPLTPSSVRIFFKIYTKIVENSGRIFKCSINLMQCDCRFDLAAMPNEES
jgi:hypothetical protein